MYDNLLFGSSSLDNLQFEGGIIPDSADVEDNDVKQNVKLVPEYPLVLRYTHLPHYQAVHIFTFNISSCIYTLELRSLCLI